MSAYMTTRVHVQYRRWTIRTICTKCGKVRTTMTSGTGTMIAEDAARIREFEATNHGPDVCGGELRSEMTMHAKRRAS